MARRQQADALSNALAIASQLFLDKYSSFVALQSAVADLDVLAGFATATQPGNAPAGCSFCRPQFVAAAPLTATASANATAPRLELQAAWHPLLAIGAATARVTPNDLCLGGDAPGTLLLTGMLT